MHGVAARAARAAQAVLCVSQCVSACMGAHTSTASTRCCCGQANVHTRAGVACQALSHHAHGRASAAAHLAAQPLQGLLWLPLPLPQHWRLRALSAPLGPPSLIPPRCTPLTLAGPPILPHGLNRVPQLRPAPAPAIPHAMRGAKVAARLGAAPAARPLPLHVAQRGAARVRAQRAPAPLRAPAPRPHAPRPLHLRPCLLARALAIGPAQAGRHRRRDEHVPQRAPPPRRIPRLIAILLPLAALAALSLHATIPRGLLLHPIVPWRRLLHVLLRLKRLRGQQQAAPILGCCQPRRPGRRRPCSAAVRCCCRATGLPGQ